MDRAIRDCFGTDMRRARAQDNSDAGFQPFPERSVGYVRSGMAWVETGIQGPRQGCDLCTGEDFSSFDDQFSSPDTAPWIGGSIVYPRCLNSRIVRR